MRNKLKPYNIIIAMSYGFFSVIIGLLIQKNMGLEAKIFSLSHGAHSLKMLSVFHGMLVVGTDAIRAKTTKWTVPVTAHRIRQTNLKD